MTSSEETGKLTSSYLNFSFFKVDPKWRWLNEIANTKMKVRTYSTLGLHDDAEFMLWMVSYSVEKMQILTSKIYSTVLGKYLEHSQIYLSASRQSIYSNKVTPAFATDKQPMKYAIVYPFVKSREWYLLRYVERQ